MPAHLIAEEGPYRGLILNLSEGQEWVIGRDPDEAAFVIEDSTVSRKAAKLTRTDEGITLKNLSKVNPTLINDVSHSEPVLLNEGDRVQIGNSVFLFSEKPLPETGAPPKKQRKKKKEAYDNIFGSEEPPPPEEAPEREEEESEEAIPLPRAEPTAYDTIFEDEGGEELPFNLISENPFLLKVISGPNAGAEIGMDKGRTYTIGKDPNTSDIVFQDLSVSRNHARLTVGVDGVIEIEDLGSKNGTVVNGTPVL
ncbi:MAG: FHA domain-containing protein, partial [Chlamydiota bacterium]